MTDNRAQFATRLGVVAVTVGSAVGLGNIWRFPFEAGEHGGGAFLLLNLLFVLIIGVPVICAEFIVGRHTGANVRTAFRKLAPGKGWGIIGFIGLLSSILIISFYSVVAGWTMEYIFRSITGFSGVHSVEGLHDQFDAFARSDWRPAMWTVIFLLCNYFSEGLSFLFNPDFSKITPSVVLSAMGQAFFSLSLGLGCLITYSSYFSRKTSLIKTAATTASLDMLVAILAGVIIFPAVFTFGQEPAAGPKLVFEVLPSIFSNMAGGVFWSTLFFILLFLASLTSTISMSEIQIAYFVEEKKMSRRKATNIAILAAMILGVHCALSFGCLSDMTLFGMTLFDLFDFLSSNILLPLGGMLISVFVGWFLKRSVVDSELINGSRSRFNVVLVKAIVLCLRFIAPAGILTVFIFGLIR